MSPEERDQLHALIAAEQKAKQLKVYLVWACILLVIVVLSVWGSDNEPNPYDEPEQCRGAMCP